MSQGVATQEAVGPEPLLFDLEGRDELLGRMLEIVSKAKPGSSSLFPAELYEGDSRIWGPSPVLLWRVREEELDVVADRKDLEIEHICGCSEFAGVVVVGVFVRAKHLARSQAANGAIEYRDIQTLELLDAADPVDQQTLRVAAESNNGIVLVFADGQKRYEIRSISCVTLSYSSKLALIRYFKHPWQKGQFEKAAKHLIQRAGSIRQFVATIAR